MAKRKPSNATAKAVALSAEKFQKLSPEEQMAHFTKLQSENSELKAAVKESVKGELPTFTVDEAGETFEAGEYEFTAPTFTWDDNTVINVHELMVDAESANEKVALKASAIISSLVARNSGIVKRKED